MKVNRVCSSLPERGRQKLELSVIKAAKTRGAHVPEKREPQKSKPKITHAISPNYSLIVNCAFMMLNNEKSSRK